MMEPSTFPEFQMQRDEYSGEFPHFERPRVVGFFSNDSGQVRLDTSNLRFTRKLPKPQASVAVQFDLNHNIESLPPKQLSDMRETYLLDFILNQQDKIEPLLRSDNLDDATFIGNRGYLTELASTLCGRKASWRTVATLYKGSIYLRNLYTAKKIDNMNKRSDFQLQLSSYGYKFQQYILSDRHNSEPNVSSPVDVRASFTQVLSTNLNQHRLLYAAKVDGFKHEVDAPPATQDYEEILKYLNKNRTEFVKIHTNWLLSKPRTDFLFRSIKMQEWWTSNFLAGVENTIIGFRNQKGIVEKISVYSTKQLEEMCKEYWTPNICFNSLDAILTHIKRCLRIEVVRRHGENALNDISSLPPLSLHFESQKNEPIRVTNYDEHADPTLPDYFLDGFRNV